MEGGSGWEKKMIKTPGCKGEDSRGLWGRGVGWDGKMSGKVFDGKGCPVCSGKSWCLFFNCLTSYVGISLPCVSPVPSKASAWINLSISCTHSHLGREMPPYSLEQLSNDLPSAGRRRQRVVCQSYWESGGGMRSCAGCGELPVVWTWRGSWGGN